MNSDTKKYFNETKKVLQNKKFQNIAVIILFLITLFIGINIRIQPIVNGNLIDVTTGDYTPLALDPYYFLRISETLHETKSNLPAIDNMRYQALNSGWSDEILPQSTLFLHKVISIVSPNSTLNFANVLNPVIFFALGLIIFFVLVWFITKNKWIATISSFILAIIPPYLYRTLGGFSDHESIGMFGFFLAILFFAIGMFYLEKKKIIKWKSSLLGLITGFMTMLAIASWGGGAKFLFMIFPLAFLIKWFINKEKDYWNYVLFYGLFVFGVLISAPIFGFESFFILKAYMLSSAGILTLFALGYSFIETLIFNIKYIPKKLKEYSKLTTIISVIVLGGIFYQLFVGSFFAMFGHLISKIINPFGIGRVGLTVAENKQPYLHDWISQVGKFVFYTMLVGCFIIGGKIAKGIKHKKLRPLFTGTFAFFILGILYSRISATSILNGENFISKAFFFVSFLSVAISSIYIYSKSEWKIDSKWILIVAWMIPMLLATRSAIRVFFAIVPFVAFIIPLTILEINNWRKNKKDDLIKFFSIILTIFMIVMLLITSIGYYKSVKQQADYQTPSYNTDWQNAMGWVRNNTAEGSVFLHWWDYGYWVQTGGNRPTVTDGGHFNGFWDHLIGRYVLTTPYPETAKSFMKAHEVSYLLIDPTDIGKYSAYSSIGDDNDSSDRASYIATFISDLSEVQETRNATSRFYRGGMVLDDDLRYKDETQDIFLPKRSAGLGAMMLEKTIQGYAQPRGIYVYNSQQYNLPIRYLFVNGELVDFKIGVNATMYLYPNLINSQAGQQLDQGGAAMYLSEKTKDSLVAKLYLMNDPENEYEELELVHEESAYPFNFYYQGFRGPIRIWEVNDMPNIIAREEFTSVSGDYGEFDTLQFIK